MDLGGVKKAAKLALDLSMKRYGTSGATVNDRQDALRHGILGVFVGKYGCYRYGSVNRVAEVVVGFLDAHEKGHPSPDQVENEMDYHNNAVSVNYYKSIAFRVSAGWLDHNVRVDKSDDEITNNIYYRRHVKISFTGDANRNDNNTLVYYK